MPNYRHARFLPRRIESILSQDFQDFELLILDDCSPDDSRRVIESYLGKPRVRAIFNASNSGSTYKQWALGLAETGGEYLWFAESDDYCDPRFLSTMVERLERQRRVGLAFCVSTMVDENDAVFRSVDEWLALRASQTGYDLARWKHDFVLNGREFCSQFMYPWNMIANGSAVVFRRSALAAAGGVAKDLRLCGDWMTYVNVLLASDVAYVATPLNYFRIHAATVRSRTQAPEYYRESQAVLQSMRSRIALLADRRLGLRYLELFVQGLLSPERRPPRMKVPLSRQWRLLRQSVGLTPVALLIALRILAREDMAELAYRLGVLDFARWLKRRWPARP